MANGWSKVENLHTTELHERSLALQSLLAITQAISQCTSAQELAQHAIASLIEFTHYACIGLFRLSDDTREFELLDARGFSPRLAHAVARLPIEASLSGRAVQNRQIVHSVDVHSDERVNPLMRELLHNEGFQEVICVPLLYRERIVGVILLLYRAPAGLSSNEIALLEAIGQSLAHALVLHAERAKRMGLEAHVHRNERLENLGLLAGGIAHDFNNFLQVLLASVGVLRQRLADDAEHRAILDEHFTESSKAIGLARDLVAQLLTFSRGGAPLKRPSSGLGMLVRDAAEFSAHGSSVRLEFEILDEIPAIEIDSAQFAQVIQNLVLNAIQASPPGAKIHVHAGLENAPASDTSSHRDVVISVRDFGCGIAKEHLNCIFEPYFTTKNAGHGLGLATAHAIVTRHGGTIAVTSSIEQGTTFVVRIPAALAPTFPTHAGAKSGVSLGSVGHRHARLLVLEDEPAITRLLSRALGGLGYEFDLVVDGQAAVTLAKQSLAEQRPYDLLVFDLTIRGGVGGREALRTIRAFSPQMPAIATTGYSVHSADDLQREGFAEVLPKPYTIDQLAQVIDRRTNQRWLQRMWQANA